MSDENELIAVLITVPNDEVAASIATELVSKNLAACVNILPGVESVYHWEGELERSSEILLICKTTAARFADLEEEVTALHPYETPEILALEVEAVSKKYGAWVLEAVKK